MLRKVTNIKISRCVLTKRWYNTQGEPIKDIPNELVDDNNEKSELKHKKQVKEFEKNPTEFCKTIVKPEEKSNVDKKEREGTAKTIVDEAKDVARDVAKDLSKEASKNLGKKIFFRIVSIFGFK
jgi:hypothetical protein